LLSLFSVRILKASRTFPTPRASMEAPFIRI
jgi:hypothetical protein